MKQTSTTQNVLLVCVLILIVVNVGWPSRNVYAAPTAGTSEESGLVCDTRRTIQVSGSAVVNVTPDRALIQLGVQSNDTTPQKVEAANSRTINRVIRALTSLGIEEKDIVTDWYVIEPVYHSYDSLKIKGYQISNVIAITLRDIGKVNDAITKALGAGANEVVNVEFYLSNLRQYRDQARELAMTAAKEKARDLAAAAGTETGCVTNINENTWSYYNGWWYGRSRSSLWAQNVVQNVPSAGSGEGALTESGPVSLGQISVQAQVSASFSLAQ